MPPFFSHLEREKTCEATYRGDCNKSGDHYILIFKT